MINDIKQDMYGKEKIDILIKDINQDMYEKLIHGKWYVWQRENWYDKQYETRYTNMKSWTISFDLNSICRKTESLYHDR